MIREPSERLLQRAKRYDRVAEVEVMLCVTMRIFPGACYLDLTWPYGISLPTVYTVFNEFLVALDERLQNIPFPITGEECLHVSQMNIHKRWPPITGIIGALDGWEVDTAKRNIADSETPRKLQQEGFFCYFCAGGCVGGLHICFRGRYAR